MSMEIDERVVEMRFDNSNFEKNVSTSLGTIGKLKQALKFDKSSQGLETIGKTAMRITLSPLTSSAEAAAKSFNVLEGAAAVALGNIETKAINVGTQLVKSLTVDNLASGWSKYNEKTQGVQTIMAATGKSINEVNTYLEKLMWYADETSYTFTDMVSNIGKFTSAGVDLGVATDAMIGISNWAAVSGQNAQSASRAYYNLSQAIAAGSVKLIDWKSIQTANMDTLEFKQTAIDTAVALGTLKKGSDGVTRTLKGTTATAEDFTNAMSEGWFTSDVLLKTLAKYSDYTNEVYKVADAYDTCSKAMENVSEAGMELSAKAFKAGQEAKTLEEAIDSVKEAVSSGWAETFELFFGDYTQAKKLWTQLANDMWDIFAGGAQSRNKILKSALHKDIYSVTSDMMSQIKELGGYSQGLENILLSIGKSGNTGLSEYIEQGNSLEDALDADWVSANKLKKIIKDISSKDYLSGNAKKAKKTLLGMTDKEIKEEATALGLYTKGSTKSIEQLREELFSLREVYASWFTDGKLSKSLKSVLNPEDMDYTGYEYLLMTFSNAMTGLKKVIKTVKKSWTNVFPKASAMTIKNIVKQVYELSKKLILTETGTEKLSTLLQGLFSLLHVVTTNVKRLAEAFDIAFGPTIKSAINTIFVLAEALGKNLIEFDKTNTACTEIGIVLNTIAQRIANFQKKAFVLGYVLGYIIRNMLSSISASEEVRRLVGNIFELIVMVGKAVGFVVDGIFDLINGFLVLHNIKPIEGDNIFSLLLKGINKVLELILSLQDLKFDGLFNTFSDLGSKIKNVFSEGGQAAVDFGVDLGGMLIPLIENVKLVFGGLFGYLVERIEFLKGVPWGTVLGIASLVYTVRTIKLITNTITGFAKSFTLVTGLNSVLGAIAKSFKAKAWRDMSVAIALLVVALDSLLLTVDAVDSDKLTECMFAMAAIGVTLYAFMTQMTKLTSGAAGIAMIGIAADLVAFSIAMIAALKTVQIAISMVPDNGDISKLLGAAAIYVIAGGVMLAVSYMLTIMQKKLIPNARSIGAAIQGALNMIAFSSAIFMMIGSIYLLTKIDFKPIKHSLPVVLSILGMLGGLLIAARGVSKGASAAGSGLLKAVVALYLLIGVVKLIKRLDNTEKALGVGCVAVMGVVTVILAKLIGKNGEYADKAAKVVSKIGVMLLLTAAAMKILGTMDWDKLAMSAGAMLVLMFGIAKIIKQIVWMRYTTPDAAKAIRSLTGILSTLGVILFFMGVLEPATTLQNALALSMVVAALAGVVLGIAEINPASMKSAAGILFAMSGLLIVIAGIIGLMEDHLAKNGRAMSDCIKISEALGIVILSLGGTLALMSGVTISKAALTSAAIMVAILGGVSAVLVGLTNLNPCGWQNTVGNAVALGITMTALATAIKIIDGVGNTQISDNVEKSVAIMCAVLLAASVALVALGVGLTATGNENMYRDMPAIALSLGLVMVAMAESMRLIINACDNKYKCTASALEGIRKTLWAMLPVMVVAGVVLAAFNQHVKIDDYQSYITNTIALGVLLNALAASVVVLSQAKEINKGVIKSAFTMTAVLAGIGTVLGALQILVSDINPTNMIVEATALGVLLNALAASVIVLSQSKDINKGVITAALGMSVVMAAIAGVLGLLQTLVKDVDPVAMITEAVALGGLLTVISANIGLLNLMTKGADTGKLAQSVGIMALLSLVSILLTATLAGLANSGASPEQMIAAAISLGAILTILSVDIGILSLVGQLGVKAAAAGILALAMLSLAIMAMAELFDIIGTNMTQSDIDAIMLAVEGIKTVSIGLGEAIGGFVGAILGSAIDTALAGLENFINVLVNGFERLGDVDVTNAAGSIATLVSAYGALIGISAFGGITAPLLGNMMVDSFGKSLGKFVDQIIKIIKKLDSEGISNVDLGTIDVFAGLIKSLGEAAQALPNTGGVVSWFTGDNDIGEFAEKLKKAGTALFSFIRSIRGSNFEEDDKAKVTLVCEILGAMATAAKDLPNSGGLAGFFAGDNDIQMFGSGMAMFATSLESFISTARRIKPSNADIKTTENIVAITAAMASVAEDLPNDGGWIGAIFGENNLSDFGKEMANFVPHLTEFLSGAEGLPSDAQEISSVVALSTSIMANIMKNIPVVDTWADKILSTDHKLVKFGEEMENFAPHFKGFSDGIHGIRPSEVKMAAWALKEFVLTFSGYEDSGNILGDTKLIKKISNSMQYLGSGLGVFWFTMGDPDKYADLPWIASGIKLLVSALEKTKNVNSEDAKEFKTALTYIGSIAVDKLIDSFAGTEPLIKIKGGVNAVMCAIHTKIESGKSDFEADGAHIIDYIFAGMSSEVAGLQNDIMEIMSGLDDQLHITLHVEGIDTGKADGKQYATDFVAGEAEVIAPVESHAYAGAPSDTVNTVSESENKAKKAKKAKKEKKEAVDNAKKTAESSVKANNETVDNLIKAQGGGMPSGTVNYIKNQGNAQGAAVGTATGTAISSTLTGTVVEGVNKTMDLADTAMDYVIDKAKKVAGVSGIDISNLDKIIEGANNAAGTNGVVGAIYGFLGIDPDESGTNMLGGLNDSLDEMINQLNEAKEKLDNVTPTSTGGNYTSTVTDASTATKTLSQAMQNLPKNLEYAKKSITTVLNNKNQNKSATKIYKQWGVDAVRGILHGYNEGLAKESANLEKFTASMEKKLFKSSKNKSRNKKSQNALQMAADSLYIGSDVFKHAADNWSEALRSIGKKAPITKIRNATRSLTEEIYLESDAYKESAQQMKSYEKDLQNLYKKQQRIVKKLDSNDLTDSQKEKYAQQLENTNKNIKSTKKSINKLNKQMAKDAKNTWKEYNKGIKDALENQFDFFNVSVEKAMEFSDILSSIPEAVDVAADSFDKLTIFNSISTTASELLGTLKEISMFSKFELDYSISSLSLMETSNSQKEGYEELAKDLESLAATKLNSQLFEEIKAMGLDGLTYIKAILKMTDEELEQFNQNYVSTRSVIADDLLNIMDTQLNADSKRKEKLEQLADMGFSDSVIDGLKEMGESADEYLDTFLNMSSEQMERAEEIFSTGGASSAKSFLDEMWSTINDQKSYNEEMKKLKSKLGTTYAGVYEELESLGVEGLTTIKMINNMTDEEFKDMLKGYKENAKLTQESIVKVMSEAVANNSTYNSANSDRGKKIAKLLALGFNEAFLKELEDNQNDEWIDGLLGSSSDIVNAVNANYIAGLKATAKNVSTAMKESNDEYEEWLNGLRWLENQGFSKEFIEGLEEQGTESLSTIRAYMSLTKSEIQAEINSLKAEQERAEKMSKETANKNLIDDWQSLVDKGNALDSMWKQLTAKGLNEDIVKALREQGLEAYDIIESILADESQIEQINSLFEQIKLLPDDIYGSSTDAWILSATNIGTVTGDTLGTTLAEVTNTSCSNNLDYATTLSPTTTDTTTVSSNYTKSAKKASKAYAEGFNEETTKSTRKSTITKALKLTSAQMEKICETYTEGGTESKKAFVKAIKSVASKIESIFYDTGYNAAWGFADGLSEGKKTVKEAAKELASAALKYANATLDINSPSKKFWQTGMFSALGMANGMRDNAYAVADASEDMANNAVDALQNTIAKIVDTIASDDAMNPTITPVVDMSYVEDSISTLDNLFSRNEAMRVNATVNAAKSASSATTANTDANLNNGNNISFVQNNYSPTALSRMDIYRQTKNQIAMLKGALS